MRFALLALLVPLALSASACGVATADFTADIAITATIDDEDNFYQDFVLFDPNDSEDFRDNKDRIESGKIRRITVDITRTRSAANDAPRHLAKIGIGQIDVRAADPNATEPPGQMFVDNPEADPNGPFITGIAAWDPIALVQNDDDSPIDLKLNQDNLAEVHELLFDRGGPLEVRFVGFANNSVNFTFDVNIELDFTARVP